MHNRPYQATKSAFPKISHTPWEAQCVVPVFDSAKVECQLKLHNSAVTKFLYILFSVGAFSEYGFLKECQNFSNECALNASFLYSVNIHFSTEWECDPGSMEFPQNSRWNADNKHISVFMLQYVLNLVRQNSLCIHFINMQVLKWEQCGLHAGDTDVYSVCSASVWFNSASPESRNEVTVWNCCRESYPLPGNWFLI